MTGKNCILLAFALILLFSTANASLLVNVSPKEPGVPALSLYLDETGQYEIEVFNESELSVSNVLLKISTGEGLKLLDKGSEKTIFATTIESIGPYEKESLLVTLKPTELSANKLFVYVDYGIDEYTNLSATYVLVEENPLQINTSLSKTALDTGGEGSVSLSLKNTGTQPIQNIIAELIVFDGLETNAGVVNVSSLAPGEGYEAKEFLFVADPEVTGKVPLLMQVTFENSKGTHVIEKYFAVEIQSRQTILYLIAGIIILLIAVAIISRMRDSGSAKKLEKPVKEKQAEEKPVEEKQTEEKPAKAAKE